MSLKKALLILSQYLLFEDAQKILDYLIINFSLAKYEYEDLIINFMHYHSTIFYLKLI